MSAMPTNAHRRLGATGGGDDRLTQSVGNTRKIEPLPRHDNTFDGLTKLKRLAKRVIVWLAIWRLLPPNAATWLLIRLGLVAE